METSFGELSLADPVENMDRRTSSDVKGKTRDSGSLRSPMMGLRRMHSALSPSRTSSASILKDDASPVSAVPYRRLATLEQQVSALNATVQNLSEQSELQFRRGAAVSDRVREVRQEIEASMEQRFLEFSQQSQESMSNHRYAMSLIEEHQREFRQGLQHLQERIESLERASAAKGRKPSDETMEQALHSMQQRISRTETQLATQEDDEQRRRRATEDSINSSLEEFWTKHGADQFPKRLEILEQFLASQKGPTEEEEERRQRQQQQFSNQLASLSAKLSEVRAKQEDSAWLKNMQEAKVESANALDSKVERMLDRLMRLEGTLEGLGFRGAIFTPQQQQQQQQQCTGAPKSPQSSSPQQVMMAGGDAAAGDGGSWSQTSSPCQSPVPAPAEAFGNGNHSNLAGAGAGSGSGGLIRQISQLRALMPEVKGLQEALKTVKGEVDELRSVINMHEEKLQREPEACSGGVSNLSSVDAPSTTAETPLDPINDMLKRASAAAAADVVAPPNIISLDTKLLGGVQAQEKPTATAAVAAAAAAAAGPAAPRAPAWASPGARPFDEEEFREEMRYRLDQQVVAWTKLQEDNIRKYEDRILTLASEMEVNLQRSSIESAPSTQPSPTAATAPSNPEDLQNEVVRIVSRHLAERNIDREASVEALSRDLAILQSEIPTLAKAEDVDDLAATLGNVQAFFSVLSQDFEDVRYRVSPAALQNAVLKALEAGQSTCTNASTSLVAVSDTHA